MSTYYVSSDSGNDSNSGASSNAAFATLQKAANVVKPGDTVKVESGTYTGHDAYDVLDIRTSGTASAPITFKADTGATPVVQLDTSNSQGIVDEGASYINIQGFTVIGDGQSFNQSSAQSAAGQASTEQKGIVAWGASNGSPETHVTIQGNTVHDMPAAGIWVGGGDYVSILDNMTYNNAFWSNAGDSGVSMGWMKDSDTNTGTKNVIAGNVSHDNRNYVGDTYGGGQLTDGNGVIIDTNDDSSQGTHYQGKTLVEDNLIYGNGGAGLQFTGSNNITAVYNTAYGNNQTSSIDRGQIADNNGTDVVEENNIMVANGGAGIVDNNYSGVTEDYNVLYGGKIGVQGTHDIVANPDFVNAGGANFQLQAASPAIGVANAAYTDSTDLAGDARPAAGADIGAYEHQQGSVPAPTPTPSPPSIPDDQLVVKMSEDAYQGDAKALVSIDGKTLGTETVTALHSQGAFESFTFDLGRLAAGLHSVAVTFLNDAYGGSPSLDRNLYVDQVNYDATNCTSATVTGQYTHTHQSNMSVGLYCQNDMATFSVGSHSS